MHPAVTMFQMKNLPLLTNWVRGLLAASLPAIVFLLVWCPFQADAQASTFYVATNGHDDTGDGSPNAPWATIEHAVDTVPDSSTVLVREGTYNGAMTLRGVFEQVCSSVRNTVWSPLTPWRNGDQMFLRERHYFGRV